MGWIPRRRLGRSALPLGCAIAALWPSPAAASDTRLFTPDTIDVSADLRLVAVNGEQGWLNGGFGKLRSGSNGDWKVEPQLGNVDIAWQPQLTWSLGATVVAAIQGGERTQAGLSQAYLSFRPMRGSTSTAFSARAGLMWPPVSLEHEGSDWHVANSITPSAINSWIGEEVRPVAAEGSAAFVLGQHRLRAVAALIAANDTAGTLLTFRGWALHDRTTLAFNRWNLPPLEGMIGQIQAPYTHPLIDLHAGFAHRPGYYAKLAWQPPLPIRLELFRYDNRANPEDFNPQMEWGWRTAFDNLGLVAKIGDVDLKAQALEGRTRMGFEMDGRRWIDNRFRSAFVLLDRPFGKIGIAARTEVFDTRNRGSIVGEDYNESGWSAMLSAKREWAHFTGLVELIHVDSRRDDRLDHGLAAHQAQSELQLELRIHR